MNQPFINSQSRSPTDSEPPGHPPETALRAGGVAVWYWDAALDRCSGEPALAELAGLPTDALTRGLTLAGFLEPAHPDDEIPVRQQLEAGRQTGAVVEVDYRIRTTTPEPRWVCIRGRFTDDGTPHPHLFAGVLLDITDRKRVEARLQTVEAGLQLAVESAQLGTWDYNLLTGEISWADRTKQLFGLPLTATVDYDVFLRVLHPDDRARTDRAVQAALRPDGDGRYDIEYRAVGPDNRQMRWLRAIGQAFFSETGTARQLIGTVIDVTQTKQTEQMLQQRVSQQTAVLEEQTQQLRTILDASLNSIIAMTAMRDASGVIVDFMMETANQAVVRSNFMQPEAIVGRPLLVVFPGNRDNGFFDLYCRVVESGQSEQAVQYYRDEFGLEGWFEVSAVRLGRDGVVVTFNNITERKQTELAARQQSAELWEANTELRRSNESLQQFAHIASHDLQEPLRRIQAFSDILQNQFVDNISEGENDMIRRIQRSANRMQLLIKDLLTYSQLTTQRDLFAPVSLTTVLNDVRSDLELAIAEKQATVAVDPLPMVRGSETRLRQLFQNLIANALKFSRPGYAPSITIRVRPAQPNELPPHFQESAKPSFWLITVADNGIGFDEKYKDRIFAPFQRLHDQTRYGGTGIGLSICQRVAETHGGAIDVTSQIGVGSTFTLFLPVLTPDPA